MAAPVLLLFGLVAPVGGPAALEGALGRLENEVVRALAERGFEVRPAPLGLVRPRASDARPEAGDLAHRYGAHRVVVLDVAGDGGRLWITHYVLGVPGAWDVRELPCEGAPEPTCAGLAEAAVAGLRPRSRLDVDVATWLRSRAPGVTRCVRAEGRRPLADRIFGRLEVDLEVASSGRVRVKGIGPARVFRTELGGCLREVFESAELGAFEGAAMTLRVPVDL